MLCRNKWSHDAITEDVLLVYKQLIDSKKIENAKAYIDRSQVTIVYESKLPLSELKRLIRKEK